MKIKCISDINPLKQRFRPHDTYRQIERIEKYIPCKWEAKESWSSNPYIRKKNRT